MTKVSIIIPYNDVEGYINKCLDSVVNQSLEDIEIIMINDFSQDGSEKIVQKYAKKDKRIKEITLKERMGQGYARNRGIEQAQGEYIGFVDSDDVIKKEMFEELYNSAKKENTDITMCLAHEFDDENGDIINSDYYALKPLAVYGDKVFSAEDTKNYILDINVALWNKIYKTEYLNKTGAKFPEGFIYEDLPFFYKSYLKAKKVNIVWKDFYGYRVNRKNSTMRQSNKKVLDRIEMVRETYKILKKEKYLADKQNDIKGWIINDIFHRYSLLKENYYNEYYNKMKELFLELDIKNPQDEIWKKVYHFEGYKMVLENDYEEFNRKMLEEYLDIHKVEDRILSQVSGRNEIDKKISDIYDDINKNYKYTEEIVKQLEDKLGNIIKNNMERQNEADMSKKEIEQETAVIAKKTSEEIAKVFDYTQQQVNRLQQSADRIKEEVINNVKDINAQTDEKISRVYDEITKNYAYTNQLTEKLEDTVKSTRLGIEQNVNAKTDEKLSKIYEEITKNYEYTNKITQEAKDLSAVFKTQLESELVKSLEKMEQSVSSSAVDIIHKTDEKISRVYNEITSNYKYTEELVYNRSKDLKDEVMRSLDTTGSETIEKSKNIIQSEISNILSSASAQTDEKLSKIYEEITKNYNYINDIHSKINETTDSIYDNINKAIEAKTREVFPLVYDYINEAIEKKNKEINQIYEEITKNYEHTNKLNGEIKQNITCEVDEKISKVYDEITKNYQYTNEIRDNLNQKNTELLNNLNEKLVNSEKNFIEDMMAQKSEINELSTEMSNKINLLSEKTEEENKKINEELVNLYDKIIDESNHIKQEIENVKSELIQNKEYISDVKSDLETQLLQNENRVNKNIDNLETIMNEQIEEVRSSIGTEFEIQNKKINAQREEINKELEEKYSKSAQELQSAKEEIYSYLDHQVDKSNAAAEEKVNNLKNDVEDKISLLAKTQEQQMNLKFSEVYSYTNSEFTKAFKELHNNNSEIAKRLELKAHETNNQIQAAEVKINSIQSKLEEKAASAEIDRLQNEMKEKINNIELYYQRHISELKSEYENQLNEQRIKYENKLINMENHIYSIEKRVTESKKGLLEKIFGVSKKR